MKCSKCDKEIFNENNALIDLYPTTIPVSLKNGKFECRFEVRCEKCIMVDKIVGE